MSKIALVSGSSRGIGKIIAEVLLKEGYIVFINGRHKNTLDKTVKEFQEKISSKNVYKFLGDLTVTKNIKNVFKIIFQKTGKYPNIVIANIGSGNSVAGWDVDDIEWQRMFNINFFGSVRLCREAIRVMKGVGGVIVCIASIAGCESILAPISYSTAKTALLSFVKNISNLTAQYNIRINAVSPGNVLFEGGTWDIKLKKNREEVCNYINGIVPMKRFATPYDVAYMVSFLVSDKAKFITGSNFVVDGGQVRKYI